MNIAKIEVSSNVFIITIAYSQFLSIIVGQLVDDRVSRMKFFQITQGMQILAYWMTNLTFDLIKMYLIVGMNLMVFAYFSINLGNAVYTLLLFPLGMIPFSYITSFIFKSVSVAQSMTLFLNFVFMLIMPLVIYFMQSIETLHR